MNSAGPSDSVSELEDANPIVLSCLLYWNVASPGVVHTSCHDDLWIQKCSKPCWERSSNRNKAVACSDEISNGLLESRLMQGSSQPILD